MTKRITKTRAKALFADLRDVLERLYEIVDEILETRAWEALGYKSFGEAYLAELAHLPLRQGRRTTDRIIVLLAEDESVDTTPDKPHLVALYDEDVVFSNYHGMGYFGKIPKGYINEARLELASGVPPEEFKATGIGGTPPSRITHQHIIDPERPVFRKSTRAALPTPPSSVRIQLTRAEYERMERVCNAAGRSPKEEARRVFLAHIDRLESELKVGV